MQSDTSGMWKWPKGTNNLWRTANRDGIIFLIVLKQSMSLWGLILSELHTLQHLPSENRYSYTSDLAIKQYKFHMKLTGLVT